MKQAPAKSVLIIGNFLSGAGGSRGVCEELAPRLESTGWNVITASSRQNRIMRLIDMIKTAVSQRQYYRVAQVDVYSGAAFLWAEVVSWVLRAVHKPYVLTLHGGNLPIFAARYPRRVRRLMQSASAITAPSAYLYEQMQPYCANPILLPNPIELANYPYRYRGTLQPQLVWLRAFHTIYNPSLAIQVVGMLKGTFPEIHLTMVGPNKGDGSFEQCQAEVSKLGLTTQVTFSGGVKKSEVPNWLQKGDIFLNTTNFDNTPVSVIEAMACGLCVVTTNVGGIPYLFTHEYDALLVPPNDAHAMADAVRRLLTEPELAKKLSQNARTTVEKYDWAIVLPQWEDLLLSVTSENQ
ncbi:Phosphatidyl-myo-inositol mannosyltransferase [Anaerolineae bacterium]|nr:Phosphatidyl-myo-inositol mannosyltransferase [Anaerolineae bacterium]